MSIQWLYEACDQRPDPESGAKIVRLTSAIAINNNIYCEQPYSSPDGKRVAIVRGTGLAPHYDSALYVADLDSIKITRVEPFTGGSNASWGEWFYCFTPARDLMAFSLHTFEKKIVLTDCEAPSAAAGSISPDNKYTIYKIILPGPTNGIVQLELETGAWRIIFDHPGCF